MRRRAGILTVALLLGSTAGLAHVRLRHPTNGLELYWENPTAIGVVIQSSGSDDVPDASDEVALRMAIQAWNAVGETAARLVEDTSATSQARTDWESDDIHLLLFDETNSSGYFPLGSTTVALTPVWFQSNGAIVDADVLFNGMQWNFTTNGVPATHFDIQDVAAHELGHLLGLNHSAYLGSTMYPYVDPTVLLHRSLSEDEVRALRTVYPAGNHGSISGKVLRLSDLMPIAGAYVVARDGNGRPVASVLTEPTPLGTGSFTLGGLAPGTYTVYAIPLGSPGGFGDAPVDVSNLGQGYFVQTDFEPVEATGPAVVTAGNDTPLPTLLADDDVSLNLGTQADRFPVRVVAGQTQTVVLHGTGLFSPATLESSDPDILVSNPTWFGSQVSFMVSVPSGEPAGHVDLKVVNAAGRVSICPAALEVTPADPSVLSVFPPIGPRGGGSALTITGTGFNPGARVVIGDQIYEDGVQGTRVLGDTTIVLTTLATSEGLHDVVVIDASGVEGRLANGFQAANLPAVSAVFPIAGGAGGGTVVTLTGQDFQPGARVRIDGVDQGPVGYLGPTQLRFTTFGGAAGGPYVLEVENPDQGIATTAFSYGASPDPVLTAVSPDRGSAQGGQTLILRGDHFGGGRGAAGGWAAQAVGTGGGWTVLFGADPSTGLGGTPAAAVTWIDSQTLQVVTPPHPVGPASVLVLNPSSGQAAVLPAAFAFEAQGPGGAACAGRTGAPPGSGSFAAAGSWIFVLGFLAARAALARRALART